MIELLADRKLDVIDDAIDENDDVIDAERFDMRCMVSTSDCEKAL